MCLPERKAKLEITAKTSRAHTQVRPYKISVEHHYRHSRKRVSVYRESMQNRARA